MNNKTITGFAGEEDSLFLRLEERSDRLQEMIMKLAGTENSIDRCNETVQDASVANSESKGEVAKTKAILASIQQKLNRVSWVESCKQFFE